MLKLGLLDAILLGVIGAEYIHSTTLPSPQSATTIFLLVFGIALLGYGLLRFGPAPTRPLGIALYAGGVLGYTAIAASAALPLTILVIFIAVLAAVAA